HRDLGAEPVIHHAGRQPQPGRVSGKTKFISIPQWGIFSLLTYLESTKPSQNRVQKTSKTSPSFLSKSNGISKHPAEPRSRSGLFFNDLRRENLPLPQPIPPIRLTTSASPLSFAGAKHKGGHQQGNKVYAAFSRVAPALTSRTRKCAIRIESARSILRNSPRSAGPAKVEAIPRAEARPVRPTRCTKSSAALGMSKLTTCATLATSRPRAATSVATSTRCRPSEKLRRAWLRCACERSP